MNKNMLWHGSNLWCYKTSHRFCWCFSIEIQSELWCQSFWAMPTWNTKVLEWSISPVKTVEHMLCHHRLLWIVNKRGCQNMPQNTSKFKGFSNGFLVGFSWWFFELVPDNHAWMMFYKLHTIEEDLQNFPNMVFLPLCVLNVSFMFLVVFTGFFFATASPSESWRGVTKPAAGRHGSLGSSKMLVGWRKWNAFWGMASYS